MTEFHSAVFHPPCLHTPMPIAIPTLKRKPNEEDDVPAKQRNEAMVDMARLAYERMKRIDEEDHERGLKEYQYNNSVKYQRMVEYELNNPGETATVRLGPTFPVHGITVRANPHPRLCVTGSTRVRSGLQEVEEEANQTEVGQGSCGKRGDEPCPGEFRCQFRELRLGTTKFSTAFVEAEEAHPESTRSFQDHLQSIHPFCTTRGN